MDELQLGEQNLAHVSQENPTDKWKQVIVIRKDLNMSPGKLAAQVSHASMAFLTSQIQRTATREEGACAATCELSFPIDMYDEWIGGVFTKVCLGAKNRNKLMRVVADAEAAGLVEGVDFFVIRDHCLTELEPEETDENGEGWTVTCLGFAPMKSSQVDPITRKLQLFR